MSGLTLLAALKAFDATARAGSMTAAAKLLDLQQPTISAHIQRLENEYGVELFLRQGRRLELTTFGRTLLGSCVALLAFLLLTNSRTHLAQTVLTSPKEWQADF